MPQQGQSQKGPRGVTDNSLHKAVALSTAQVGKDTRQHTGVGNVLLRVGGKKQSTNQLTQTETLLLPTEKYSHETADSTTIYLC